MMAKKQLVVLVSLLAGCAGAATAAAETYETRFDKRGSGDSLEAFVGFDSGCGDECHVADLTCGAGQSVTFSMAGFSAKDAAAAMVNDKLRFVIKAGKASHDFSLRQASYEGEMTGDWTLEGGLNGDQGELLTHLKTAKTFNASIGSHSLTLPVNKDVLNWVKACP